MNKSISIPVKAYIQGLNTKKAFFMYTLNEKETKVINWKFTNDYSRYKKEFKNFKVVSCISFSPIKVNL